MESLSYKYRLAIFYLMLFGKLNVSGAYKRFKKNVRIFVAHYDMIKSISLL
jgi:hypothetical protein